jgi:hypothetical protein
MLHAASSLLFTVPAGQLLDDHPFDVSILDPSCRSCYESFQMQLCMHDCMGGGGVGPPPHIDDQS